MDALRDRLDAALGSALEERWDEVLAEWSEEEEGAGREQVLADVNGLRDRLRETLLGFSSERELRRGIAVAYAEAKSRWTLLTSQIRDTTKRDGRVDESLVFRATCVSLIVQQLDPLAGSSERADVAEFLEEPLD